MRCLTVSNGTVTEESKLRFPDDVTLRNVAPGNHSGMYLTNWDGSSPNQYQRCHIYLRDGRISTIHLPGVRQHLIAFMASSAWWSIGWSGDSMPSPYTISKGSESVKLGGKS